MPPQTPNRLVLAIKKRTLKTRCAGGTQRHEGFLEFPAKRLRALARAMADAVDRAKNRIAACDEPVDQGDGLLKATIVMKHLSVVFPGDRF